MDFITLDFETYRIEDRPQFPPRPVGLAVKYPKQPGVYHAFGHISGGNNCLENEAACALRRTIETGLPLVFHNAKFDIHVMLSWLNLTIHWNELPWHRVHDTSFLAFLLFPHAKKHDLKSLADSHLNWPPGERDEVSEWVWAHKARIEQAIAPLKLLNAKGDGPLKVNRRQGTNQASNAMEFMQYVPGDLAGKYAIGDVDRTAALFEKFGDEVQRLGMTEAYNRERQLLPILIENERDGIRVDVYRLGVDLDRYRSAYELVEQRLRTRLNAPNLNFDADQDLAHTLINAGVVAEKDFPRTPVSKEYQVGKENLTPDLFADPRVASALGYRNRLHTCMVNFMEPWLRQGAARGGFVSTGWNQTRGGDGGTRTGRPSTSGEFNLLNISKDFEGRPDGYEHPIFLGVPKLPLVRQYMLPDQGHTWMHRDFSGQELRVFAHYESGALLEAYLADPSIDPHAMVRDVLMKLSPKFFIDPDAPDFKDRLGKLRTQVKVTNFRSIYGGGLGAIQKALRVSRQEAQDFRSFHSKALPGLKILNEAIEKLARNGNPIKTWGGRLYHVEDPVGQQTFYYKLINYLVQGSAADLTKQSIIDWYNVRDKSVRFLVTVYDEINVTCPIDIRERQMQVLREQMCLPRLDCPMLSDGKWGPTWGDLEKCA